VFTQLFVDLLTLYFALGVLFALPLSTPACSGSIFRREAAGLDSAFSFFPEQSHSDRWCCFDGCIAVRLRRWRGIRTGGVLVAARQHDVPRAHVPASVKVDENKGIGIHL